MGPIEIMLLALAGVLLALVLVILIRTLSFKPKAQCEIDSDNVEFDKERVVKNLQDLVRCKTVSKYSHDDEDNAEFEKFLSILPELYPNVYKNCEFKIWMEMAGRTLSFLQVKQLLEEGRTCRIEGFKSKAGKTFSAPLRLEEDGRVVFDFGQVSEKNEMNEAKQESVL